MIFWRASIISSVNEVVASEYFIVGCMMLLLAIVSWLLVIADDIKRLDFFLSCEVRYWMRQFGRHKAWTYVQGVLGINPGKYI